MAHAEHFLSRLGRVESRPELELALDLYRDPELLRVVLARARLPEGSSRVALSIADDEHGPFVVVERDGAFVTCLGQGMKHDLPVVTASRLRHTIDDTLSYRQQLAASRERMGPGGRLFDLFKRLYLAGAELSREEFQAVAVWQPVVGTTIYTMMADLESSLAASVRDLARLNRKGSIAREQDRLRAFWTNMWAVAHLRVLSGLEVRALAPTVAAHKPDVLGRLSLHTFWWGSSGMALRGTWAAAKAGAEALDAYAARLPRMTDYLRTLDCVFAIAALGLRHSKLRGRARRLLASAESVPLEPQASDDETVAAQGRSAVQRALARVMENPEEYQEHALDGARAYCFEVFKRGPQLYASADAIPDGIAAAAVLTRDGLFLDDVDELRGMMHMLPWVAGAQAADLYLPEAEQRAAGRCWTPSLSLQLLAQYESHHVERLPARSPKLAGRNEPCPCGSGKKYKKCCGGSSAGEAVAVDAEA